MLKLLFRSFQHLEGMQYIQNKQTKQTKKEMKISRSESEKNPKIPDSSPVGIYLFKVKIETLEQGVKYGREGGI